MSNDQPSKETDAIKGEAPGNQSTMHGQEEDNALTCDMTVGSDDVTDGVIADVTSKETSEQTYRV